MALSLSLSLSLSFFMWKLFLLIVTFFPFFLQRGVPPAEAPFIVEDMPQMHRFVFDFYSQYVRSLRAQQEVKQVSTLL